MPLCSALIFIRRGISIVFVSTGFNQPSVFFFGVSEMRGEKKVELLPCQQGRTKVQKWTQSTQPLYEQKLEEQQDESIFF